MKQFLTTKTEIKDFLEKHSTVYDLNECVKNKGLILYNNIEFGGRVSNFLIDFDDIKYYMDVLDKLELLNSPPINVTYEYLNENVIEKLIQWIQMRLNTSVIYKFSYWDFLNILYTQKCFKKTNFKSLAISGNSNTNIRNLFFGDCREHEVLLHVLLKLYLQHHNLTNEFKIYKYYGYGTTITQLSKNKEFWDNSSPIKKRGGSFPTIDDISISTWEHTHPLLYIESSNKLIALDALGHRTYLNRDMVERHNVELKIEAKPIKNRINEYTYTAWYNNLKDKSSRIYTENPTPFSKNIPYINTDKKTINGKIFGYNFNNTKLLNSKYYNPEYMILDLSSINKTDILDIGIKELCLNEESIGHSKSYSTKRF